MSTELGETELNWGTLQYLCKIAPGKRAGSKETSLCCLVLAFFVTNPKFSSFKEKKYIYIWWFTFCIVFEHLRVLRVGVFHEIPYRCEV